MINNNNVFVNRLRNPTAFRSSLGATLRLGGGRTRRRDAAALKYGYRWSARGNFNICVKIGLSFSDAVRLERDIRRDTSLSVVWRAGIKHGTDKPSLYGCVWINTAVCWGFVVRNCQLAQQRASKRNNVGLKLALWAIVLVIFHGNKGFDHCHGILYRQKGRRWEPSIVGKKRSPTTAAGMWKPWRIPRCGDE